MPPPKITSDGSAWRCTATLAVAENRLQQRCIMVFTGSTFFPVGPSSCFWKHIWHKHALGDMLVARAEERSKLVGGEITVQKSVGWQRFWVQRKKLFCYFLVFF
ncbi:uncharacterized protein LOC109810561 [Cajanus cajan]|uniref:uncharacterized protein LOC109810561 n=1 Tax=Cajanus cajan TaxID=3821 RepID=UPI00098D9850|nr:uncharacterized protein LOC109810561 [Cajanus cajan]